MKKLFSILLILASIPLSVFAQSDTTTNLPHVTITADSVYIPYGGSTTITWTSVNTSYCVASEGSDGWSGAKSPSGSFYTGSLYSNTTYCITAFGTDSNTSFECTTVVVDKPVLFVPGRAVGAGTFVQIQAYMYPQDTLNLKGFTLIADRSSDFYPVALNVDWPFHNWLVLRSDNPIPLKVIGVGNPVKVSANQTLGTIGYVVSENVSDTLSSLPAIKFKDGNGDWSVASTSMRVLQIHKKYYGDYSGDGKVELNDVIKWWPWVGQYLPDDYYAVIGDVSGQGGPFSTWDEYNIMKKALDSSYVFPVFSYSSTTVVGLGKATSSSNDKIELKWEKTKTGEWGVFSKTAITNGSFKGNAIASLRSNSKWFKIANGTTAYFINQDNNAGPLFTATNPFPITAKVNEGITVKINIPEVTTSIESTKKIPEDFKLIQNYPNPFNPSTVIKYSIPQNGMVTLKVYNILGQEVRTLVDEEKPAGEYNVKFNAEGLSSGVYLYTIRSGNFVSSKKMMLAK